MKILFDYQTFTEQNYGGISRYFSEIIRLLSQDKECNINIASLLSNNYYLNMYGFNKSKFLSSIHFRGKRRLMKVINREYAKMILKRNDFDIFHPTYFDTYFLPYIKNKPYVLTVHDLIYEIFSNDYPEANEIRNSMRELVWHAKHIISVSNSTKKDIINYYGIDKNKITTIYHGNSLKINLKAKIINKFNKNYFLFVGHRDGYKNFSNLLISIAPILKEHKILLICSGGNIANKEEIELINELSIKNYVFIYSWLLDEELIDLYNNALALIFPSRYEGFGIPILEAFACRCPVLLSNSSSLPEIAGDAALYFDPISIESIRNTINNFLSLEKSEIAILKEKGFNRLEMFSWNKAYLETLEVYKKLI